MAPAATTRASLLENQQLIYYYQRTTRDPARCMEQWRQIPLFSTRDAKTFQIASVMQTGKNVGMQTLDDAIQDLLTKKWISPEEAYEKSIDKNRFAKFLKTPPDVVQ
jgi:Tfp pilus assembly ATPase PilU